MWLPDLSAADPWHILEFAFAVSMILSMKFTPTSGHSVTRAADAAENDDLSHACNDVVGNVDRSVRAIVILVFR